MNNRIALVLLLSTIIGGVCFAGWERTYGGVLDDRAYDIIPALDGGYLITGRTESFGFGGDEMPDIYLYKIDGDGNMQWSKTYGYASEDEEGVSLLLLPDAYIVGGTMYSPESDSRDFVLMKLDEFGDTLWVRNYGGTEYEELKGAISTHDGGFLLVGITHSFGAGSFGDTYIVRTDSLGDTLWTRCIGEPSFLELARSAIQTGDGGFIVSITELEVGVGYNDLVLLRLDEYGDSVWVKRYCGPYHEWGKKIIETSDGNYLLTGGYGTAPYIEDWWLLKIDGSGDTLWTKTYGGWRRSRGENIRLMPDGGFIAVNSAESETTGEFDIWVARLDSTGDTLWNSYFGGDDHDLGASVVLTPDGGFIIAGSVSSFGAGGYDCFVAKLDSLGHSTINEKKTFPITSEIRCSPNPFNSAVRISVETLHATSLQIEIFDISGRCIAKFGGGDQIWKPEASVGSGVYLVRARFDRLTDRGEESVTKRVVYLK